jgi:hypothetical protein
LIEPLHKKLLPAFAKPEEALLRRLAHERHEPIKGKRPANPS